MQLKVAREMEQNQLIQSARMLAITAICLVGIIRSASAIVIGTFNSFRAGNANLVNGSETAESRAALEANFPDATLTGIPALSPEPVGSRCADGL
ncbi:MAG TPA: hypothetical protein VHV08_09605 [Pirellulales bacterium]|nr:hypothetical protein [Pirellulales bacterium]